MNRRFISTNSFLRLPLANGQLPKASALKPQSLKLNISDRAVQKIISLSSQDTKEMLRVKIDSGGCHGYQYGFEMTRKREDDDILFESGGAAVLVDEVSYPFLAGAEIDYVDELIGSSFKVANNPNAESECGCKISAAFK